MHILYKYVDKYLITKFGSQMPPNAHIKSEINMVQWSKSKVGNEVKSHHKMHSNKVSKVVPCFIITQKLTYVLWINATQYLDRITLLTYNYVFLTSQHNTIFHVFYLWGSWAWKWYSIWILLSTCNNYHACPRCYCIVMECYAHHTTYQHPRQTRFNLLGPKV